MSHVLDVARHLIAIAREGVEPQYLTQLQLQKLVYYVQGWSLAKRGRLAFDSPLEGWMHGPVAPSLWPEFRAFEAAPIVDYDPEVSADLSLNDRYFIRCTWETYKDYSPGTLWQKTHSERPWLEAREGLAPMDRGNKEISEQTMREFFTSETRDRINFDNERTADWRSATDESFIRAAQAIFARRHALLRRLA